MSYILLKDTFFRKKGDIFPLCQCGKHYINNGIGYKKKYVENNKKIFGRIE